MTDYISREALLRLISIHPSSPTTEREDRLINAFISVVKAFPAADVRPVRMGKWVPDFDFTEYDFDGSTPLSEPRKFQDGWQCILCGQYMPSKSNFCPNCGAWMEES